MHRAFDPLPEPFNETGAERLTGVEIEFAHLAPEDAAQIVEARFGGRLQPDGPEGFVLKDALGGDWKVYLDTALRAKADTALERAGLELGRALVPVEVVTPPLAHADLGQLDGLVRDLRRAGALGSGGGWLYGFGLHLNPEVPRLTGSATVHILTAFALAEDWLRAHHPIDPTRRLLPFTDPYPRSLVDALAEAWPDLALDALAGVYAAHRPSRNRGLDMLPLLRHLDEAAFARLFPGEENTGARPAFHYRLPDSRIDEPGWSLAVEWNRWVLVERIAADRAAMAHLVDGWQAHRAALTTLRGDWAGRSGAILTEHGLV